MELPRSVKMDRKLYLSSKYLAVLGTLVSIYMTIYKLTANDSMCLGSGDCSTVNASSYSEVFGIPVGFIGFLGYFTLFLLLQYENKIEFLKKNGVLAVFGFTLTGFIFTLWLIYIEFFVLFALCPFCLISQTTMTIMFVLSSIRLFKQL